MFQKNLLLTSWFFIPKLIKKRLTHSIRRTFSLARKNVLEDDIIFETKNGKGIVTLNRPKALNALNLSMIEKLDATLKAWQNDKTLVIIKSRSEKAFCTGGDVRAVAEGGLKYARKFFSIEYPMNALIGAYKIPYIALIDGIVMGGGVGVSVHGRYRVATERTQFAMPEVLIGLFPDVGGSYFLPRMPGKLGYYIGLTGDRLKGHDVLQAGIATHYCQSKDLAALEAALLHDECRNERDIEDTLSVYSHNAVSSEFSLAPILPQIDWCFSAATVEEILSRLEENGSKWALDAVKMMNKMSPTSLKVTLKQLNLGSKKSLPECMDMEYIMVENCLVNKDLYEGARALLIDKDQKPVWSPSKLADVSEDLVDSHFLKLSKEQELEHKL